MNKRNWLVLLLIGAFAMTIFNSCKKEDETETDSGPTEWERSNAFVGSPRNLAATFTLGDVAYVVGGKMKNNELLSDGYSFDGSSWTRIADFNGPLRHGAVAFGISGKGYVGLGYGADGEESGYLKDFYQYDPAGKTWKKVADFPGEGRVGAVAFTIGEFAYVGLGTNEATDQGYLDFYKYDPKADKWSQINAGKFTVKPAYAFAFVINNVAYIGGGYSNGQPSNDFHAFDGTTWTKKGDLSNSTRDARRFKASAFTVGGNGYVVSGQSLSGVVPTVWKYNPADDSWSDGSQSLPSARINAVGFAVKGKGYITTGNSGSSFFDDTYEFTPVR